MYEYQNTQELLAVLEGEDEARCSNNDKSITSVCEKLMVKVKKEKFEELTASGQVISVSDDEMDQQVDISDILTKINTESEVTSPVGTQNVLHLTLTKKNLAVESNTSYKGRSDTLNIQSKQTARKSTAKSSIIKDSKKVKCSHCDEVFENNDCLIKHLFTIVPKANDTVTKYKIPKITNNNQIVRQNSENVVQNAQNREIKTKVLKKISKQSLENVKNSESENQNATNFENTTKKLKKENKRISSEIDVNSDQVEKKRKSFDNETVIHRDRQTEPTQVPKTDVLQTVKDETKSDKHTMYYCEHCNTYMHTIEDIHKNRYCCNKKQHSICLKCGLSFYQESMILHTSYHDQIPNLSLKNINVFSIENNELIIPPMPKYYQCFRCKINFESKLQQLLLHICYNDNIKCEFCHELFYDKLYPVHRIFHIPAADEPARTAPSHVDNNVQRKRSRSRISYNYFYSYDESDDRSLSSLSSDGDSDIGSYIDSDIDTDFPQNTLTIYKCSKCSVATTSQHGVSLHRVCPTKYKVYCDLCNQYYWKIRKNHKRFHLNNPNFSSEQLVIKTFEPKCDVSWLQNNNEIRTVQQDLNLLPEVFTTNSYDNEDYNQILLFKCVLCDVYFTSQQICVQHTHDHKKFDPIDYIECKVCHIRFEVENNSICEHMRDHGTVIHNIIVEEYTPVDNGKPKICLSNIKLV